MKLLYPLSIQNDFVFNSSPRDFTVEEIPLYEFSGEGEHLVIKVRKKELTTWEMIAIIANHLGIKHSEIGYAGLKDKNAMTIQHISVLAKYEDRGVEELDEEKLPILLNLKYRAIADAENVLGGVEKIRSTFFGFQKILYSKANL